MIVSKFKQIVIAASIAPLMLAAGCNQTPSLSALPATPQSTLTVASVNPASGVAVTAAPADLNNLTGGNSSLTLTYYQGTSVVLTAPAISGISTFSSWTGCTSSTTLTCNVTLGAGNNVVTANYTPPPVLTVTSANPTFGVSVSVSPNDANGAGTGVTSFTRTYASGSAVTLTAPATSGATNFSSWSGCSTSSGPTCNVTLTANRTVTANYAAPLQNFGLTVNSTNPASGVTVTASPADVNAKSSSTTGGTFSYPSGSTVTLTAPANSGSTIFQGWSGCLPAVANSLTCSVSIASAKTVTANYYAAPVGHTYYVGPSGNDSNSGLSIATPFLTLAQAANSTAPGDVVYALTGTYTGATPTSTVLGINTSGTAAAPIAYRAYPGSTPTIQFSSFTGIGFGTVAYIEVNGFTVNGNNQNVTLAQASTADAIANPGNYPQFNGNCVFADGRTSTTKPSHLSILNNVVSNCGAGISVLGSDYITISGNTVFNCSWYAAYGTSAISVLGSYNSDSSTATKIFITGNRIYNNYELVPYHVTSPLTISDGEGIIIDTNENSSISGSGLTYAAYTGRTLIDNNVIYANGSSAIEIFNSAHVDVVNNSTYGNLHTPVATAVSTTTGLNYAAPTGRGELAVLSASDVNVYNNILYSSTGQNPYNVTGCTGGCGLTANYNVYYNGSNIGSAVNGANDLYANPIYGNASTANLAAVDLSLVVGSPAIDSGTATLAPAVDFYGIARPQGLGYDRGAFER
jgi:parallel beta-helix repeat protein